MDTVTVVWMGVLKNKTQLEHYCSVLEKSHIGAKSDFEIWGFKGFFSLDPKKGPKEGS